MLISYSESDCTISTSNAMTGFCKLIYELKKPDSKEKHTVKNFLLYTIQKEEKWIYHARSQVFFLKEEM